MISLLLSIALLTPVPFELVSDLEISIEHLKRHKRAPHEGFLLKLGDLNLIRSRMEASTRLCDTQILTLKEAFKKETDNLTATHNLELVGYVGRIDDLNATIIEQEQELEEIFNEKKSISRSYAQYRIVSYVVASVLVGGAIYSHFIF